MRYWTAAAVAGLALAAAGCSVEPADPVADDQSTSAEVMCEEFIERKLKAPGSAEYPEPTTTKDGATYTVVGSVDSQNSFGAQVRNDYTCVIRSEGDDKWTLVDLDLTNK